MSSITPMPTSKLDNDELMHVLLYAIPKQNRRLWHNTPQFQCLLMNAGLPLLPDKFVQTSFQRCNKLISRTI